MPCIVCNEPDKYKCPKCASLYCSVKCYKVHTCQQLATNAAETNAATAQTETAQTETAQTETAQTETEKAETATAESTETKPLPPQLEQILSNSSIAELVNSPNVQPHLKLIASTLHDPAISREQSAEGRRFVALKKIRELRKGGREANSAIEELAQLVISQHTSSN